MTSTSRSRCTPRPGTRADRLHSPEDTSRTSRCRCRTRRDTKEGKRRNLGDMTDSSLGRCSPRRDTTVGVLRCRRLPNPRSPRPVLRPSRRSPPPYRLSPPYRLLPPRRLSLRLRFLPLPARSPRHPGHHPRSRPSLRPMFHRPRHPPRAGPRRRTRCTRTRQARSQAATSCFREQGQGTWVQSVPGGSWFAQPIHPQAEVNSRCASPPRCRHAPPVEPR